MGPVSFVMVLIGCTQGQACKPITTLPIAYRSEARCLAERADMVSATDGLGYERVVAECRKQPGGERTSAPVESARPGAIA